MSTKRPRVVLRLLAIVALLAMGLAATVTTAVASPPPSGGAGATWDGDTVPPLMGAIESDDAGFDAFADGAQEVYFASVGNDEDFGLGPADTSITVQNIDVDDAYIFIWVGTGDGWQDLDLMEVAYLGAGASKTFTADELGIAEGTTVPVVVAGYNHVVDGEDLVPVYLAGVAKQAVDGENLPYTSSADTSVSGYNGVSGREVGYFDQLYLPVVQTNGGPGGPWNTIIRVANVGLDDNAAATVRFFPANDGSGSLNSGFQVQTNTLDVGETWSIDLSTLVPEGWVGSAHIYTDDAVVAIADRYKAGTDMWITNTAANAQAEGFWQEQFGSQSAPYVLFAPDVRLDFNGWNTGISVANTVATDTQVTIQYYGNNGNAPAGQTARLAAHGMTYFYNPSAPGEDDCQQPADQVPTCDFIGGAVVLSDHPVAAAVDGVKYFGDDANVGQAFSYAATGNVFEFQAAPLVQKGTASTGMGDTSGITFLNPNAETTFVEVSWINPSGFGADNFGNVVVRVPGDATGFVYTMFQHNLPNGFLGSALVYSELPIAATTANVNYAVDGDGTAIWNLYNPCGFFRQLGDCEVAVPEVPPGVKKIDTNVPGAEVCVYDIDTLRDQDGKWEAPDDCYLIPVFEKEATGGGQGEDRTFGVVTAAGVQASIAFNAGTNEISVDVFGEADTIALFGQVYFNPIFGEYQSVGNTTCTDVPGATELETLIQIGGGDYDPLTDTTSFSATLIKEQAEAFGAFPEDFVLWVDGTCVGQVTEGTVTFEIYAPGAAATGTTDANGDIEFTLPPGDYVAVVKEPGYATEHEEFTLESGEYEVNEVNLTPLPPTPPPPPVDTVATIVKTVVQAGEAQTPIQGLTVAAFAAADCPAFGATVTDLSGALDYGTTGANGQVTLDVEVGTGAIVCVVVLDAEGTVISLDENGVDGLDLNLVGTDTVQITNEIEEEVELPVTVNKTVLDAETSDELVGVQVAVYTFANCPAMGATANLTAALASGVTGANGVATLTFPVPAANICIVVLDENDVVIARDTDADGYTVVAGEVVNITNRIAGEEPAPTAILDIHYTGIQNNSGTDTYLFQGACPNPIVPGDADIQVLDETSSTRLTVEAGLWCIAVDVNGDNVVDLTAEFTIAAGDPEENGAANSDILVTEDEIIVQVD